MTTPAPLPPEPEGTRLLKFAGLLGLGCVALCGVTGTCLFVLVLILMPQMSK
jgi:hypothetical protein